MTENNWDDHTGDDELEAKAVTRAEVIATMDIFDEIGWTSFRRKHATLGFTQSQKTHILARGKRYPAKPIFGVASGMNNDALRGKIGWITDQLVDFGFEIKNVDGTVIAKQTGEPAHEDGMISHRASHLNTILYGPPGTGKTYATARRCVEICDGRAPEDSQKNRARYTRLIDDGRIEFVTFHQSYGYEEFVEGLQPQTGNTESEGEKGELGFRLVVRDGVLKRIAARARTAGPSPADSAKLGADRTFYKMGLGGPDEPDIFARCIHGGCVLLGWGSEVDWSVPRLDTQEQILELWQKKINSSVTSHSKPVRYIHILRNEMKCGDIIVVPDGHTRFRAVGEVVGGYTFDEASHGYFANRREVRWHWVADRESESVDAFQDKQLTTPTIYRLTPDRPGRLLSFLNTDQVEPPPPHVLVIDEINRANISNIMGELITLLEEDKRKGEENEIAITLPYSRERFTLPANLHILGTMNTADRSIALLDTALRRRFQFEEMASNPDLLMEAAAATRIDLPEVLRAMNDRLEYLVDRDHLIGHAWLMKARTKEDIDEIMRRKIIPLIAEYFYDDWNKVRAVLGGTDDFVRRKTLKAPPGLSDDGEESRYRWTICEEFPRDAYVHLIASGQAVDDTVSESSS